MSDFAVCPFNPQHRMLKKHLQVHILRCTKSHPNYLVCPHNAMHRFPNKETLDEHEKNCLTKRYMSVEEPSKTTLLYGNNYFESKQFHLSEEDWNKTYS